MVFLRDVIQLQQADKLTIFCHREMVETARLHDFQRVCQTAASVNGDCNGLMI